MGLFNLFGKKEETNITPSTESLQTIEQPTITEPTFEQPVQAKEPFSIDIQNVDSTQTINQTVPTPPETTPVSTNEFPVNEPSYVKEQSNSQISLVQQLADQVTIIEPVQEELPSPVEININENYIEPILSEFETGAVIDEPRAIEEQQIALNVNPNEVVEGGTVETSVIEEGLPIIQNVDIDIPEEDENPVIEKTSTPELITPEPKIEQQIPNPITIPEVSTIQPVVEPVPIVETTPTQPVVEPIPIVEPIPTQPVVEPIPIAEPTPTQPVTEPVPIVEPIPTQPVVEPVPIVEPIPTQPVIEPVPSSTPIINKTRFCDNCGQMITDSISIKCPNCGSDL